MHCFAYGGSVMKRCFLGVGGAFSTPFQIQTTNRTVIQYSRQCCRCVDDAQSPTLMQIVNDQRQGDVKIVNGARAAG